MNNPNGICRTRVMGPWLALWLCFSFGIKCESNFLVLQINYLVMVTNSLHIKLKVFIIIEKLSIIFYPRTLWKKIRILKKGKSNSFSGSWIRMVMVSSQLMSSRVYITDYLKPLILIATYWSTKGTSINYVTMFQGVGGHEMLMGVYVGEGGISDMLT